MDVSNLLSSSEYQEVQTRADYFNKTLPQEARKAGSSLGKDDFLKILITQLQNQDPTAPVEDREFIAQMAQFSTLEQITEMGDSFAALSTSVSNNQALNLLGRSVEIVQGENLVAGTVQAVQSSPIPQVMVQGSYFPLENIQTIYEK